MEKVRIGIVGMGNMGKYHADYLIKGKVAHAELSAVCSTSPEKLSAYKDPVAVFGNGEEMIRSGSIDAVLVATPHYQLKSPPNILISFLVGCFSYAPNLAT